MELAAITIIFLTAGAVFTFAKWSKRVSIVGSNPIEAIITKSKANRWGGKAGAAMEVRYEYELSGKKYGGKVPAQNVADHGRYVENHPVGSSLKVWVAPEEHGYSLAEEPTRMEVLITSMRPFVISLAATAGTWIMVR